MTTRTPALVESFELVEICPACSGSTGSVVGEPAPSWDTEVGNCIFRHPPYEVKYCDTCGLYFKTRVFSDAALRHYYDLLPFESFESEKLFPTDILILKTFEGVKNAKILDFGCGIGRILQPLVPHNRCYGVEVNGRASDIAQRKGITIVSQAALNSGEESNFDFVILSDVFEHLDAPAQYLKLLVGALKPGGSLIISTGNGDAVPARRHLSQFWYFRIPGHLQMLSPKHLKWCAGNLNLQLGQCFPSSHYALSLRDRWRQYLQSWAFEQFQRHPKSPAIAAFRCLPGIRRAERWQVAPALTCTRDHLVATLQKR